MIDKIFSLQYYSEEGRKRLVDADRSCRGIFEQGWGTGSRDQSYEFVAFGTAFYYNLPIQRCFGLIQKLSVGRENVLP